MHLNYLLSTEVEAVDSVVVVTKLEQACVCRQNSLVDGKEEK